MRPAGILETVLYAEDLAAARAFYESVLGLECFQAEMSRNLFFYCGEQTLLIFKPSVTSVRRDGQRVPLHGALGPGHVCFAASAEDLVRWRSHLESQGVAIEADFNWPIGARSIYVRDPAGNCVEFGEPRMWGLPRHQRSLRQQKVVIATHNKGKLEEFREILAPFDVTVVSAGELGLAEPAETETSFEGNARIKAQAAMQASGLIAIADDSGLCVDALGGEPGVYTADWAGPKRDWSMAMRTVEEKLQAKGAVMPEQRTGAFMATLCVLWPDGEERIYVGRALGHLTWPPRGTLGHGYDPVFVPEGETMTFAEMTHAKKNSLSHRGRAVAAMVRDLF